MCDCVGYVIGTVDGDGYVKAEANGNVGLVPFAYILPLPLRMRGKILRATTVGVRFKGVYKATEMN